MQKKRKTPILKLFPNKKALLKKLPILFFSLICLIGGFSTMFTGKVVSVHDGDTVEVLVSPFITKKVRLYGIDAPELGQAYGQAAKVFLHKKVFLQQVLLEEIDTDQYGRLVAILHLENGENINGEMVKHGFAMVYPQFCRRVICREWKEYERLARLEKRALWGDKRALAPWKWRAKNRKRNKIEGGVF